MARPARLAPVDAPGKKPVSVKERKVTTVKALWVFAFLAMSIYGDGIVVSHLVFSEDGRAACHIGIVGLSGVTPSLATMFADNFAIWAGGLFAITVVFGLIGALIGKASE